MKKFLTQPLIWILTIGIVVIVVAYLVYQNTATKTAQQIIAEASQLYSQQQFAQALDLYQKHINQAGLVNNPEAWNNYANLLRDSNKLDQAEQAYLRAISINKLYETSFRNLLFLYSSRPELTDDQRSEKITSLIQPLQQAITAQPDSVVLVEDMISLYQELKDSANIEKYTNIRAELLSKLEDVESK
ncbi:hypothetical protein A2810_01785 [candidate division Kazan bacterium RIFCSPHIGHO2_01_FULL_49_10]|uniref:Uncharacterized protein n=1 Tax=candidate division Kazan bacterium RIFCSPLOWO2_01_FULL_48_13 TaxID=1798539 RepID=A0A1F4PN14_UNCK3|nr:MAG: hypothetical protein A2810_01785 [candidate division Kazan bacterium RIFCSPHIGHO2_01_FULL_49_10]OGB85028.1 MAG: hypothetical protein A2994_00215 [candidate division Kazan bacterium RIFCSPLOWO2_01_FULL_48_13]